jgi:hypothetical protein
MPPLKLMLPTVCFMLDMDVILYEDIEYQAKAYNSTLGGINFGAVVPKK